MWIVFFFYFGRYNSDLLPPGAGQAGPGRDIGGDLIG